MRLAGILILLFVAGRLSAQRFNGVVLDQTSKTPVADATVFNKLFAVYTSETGNFSLGNTHIGDTVIITHIGYKTYKFAIAGGLRPFTTLIYLQLDTAWLNEVTIRAKRNLKKDSLSNRREFARTFAYKPTGVKDVFGKKSVYANNGPNSTAAIASIDILQVIKLFTRSSDKTLRLQKDIVRDEQNNYIGQYFSRERIMELTPLKGDSLLDFMMRYSPPINLVRQMHEYDMVQYIKKSYAEFIKPKHPK